MLFRGEADLVLACEMIPRAGIRGRLLGDEEYVLVEARHGRVAEDVYLDHDVEDTVTVEFLRLNRIASGKIRRSFLDEIYGIIEACSPGPYLELFARFRRAGWIQWGNEDVERNSLDNVAHRKGHIEPQLRLLESPKGYRGGLSGNCRCMVWWARLLSRLRSILSHTASR